MLSTLSLRRSLPAPRLRTTLLLALFLRVLWILLCPNEPSSDQVMYDEYARMIAQGNGYSYANGEVAGWWPVGYPALVAPFYFLFGEHHAVAYGLNTVLGCLSILFCFLIGRDLISERAGRFAAFLFCIHPSFILYTTALGSENAAIPTALLFVWLCVLGAKTSTFNWRLAAVTGLVLAAAAYVRAPSVLLGLCPLLLAMMWHQSWARAFAFTALTAAVCVALLLPWGFRNQQHFERFSLFSLNGQSNFWMGNHEGTDGGYTEPPAESMAMSLVDGEDYMGEQAWQFVRDNPGQYLKLCVQRSVMTLQSDTIAVEWNKIGIYKRFGEDTEVVTLLKLTTTAFHYLLLLGVLAALYRWCGREHRLREVFYLFGAAALTAAPFILIVGGNRYHLPMMAFCCILVGWILSEPIKKTTVGRSSAD
ncbi:MAG: hypothetical protein GY747_05300 [Planctomycetes bacterium]|nr:hypothetical protein [Planctomycetota bacterium]